MTKRDHIYGIASLIAVTIIAMVGLNWAGRYQENVDRMRNIPLGAPRSRLITELGKPVQQFYSEDGRFESLQFNTPPIHSVILSATVDISSACVVQIIEDEGPARTLSGYEQTLLQHTDWRKRTIE